jgi:enamine deaminase RidA (YjgF/YER057c/UK114 family)
VGAGEATSGDSKGGPARYARISIAFSKGAGAKLADMVQMTVFITDVRYGGRLTQIRRETFGNNFPASAFITIAALANPDAKIEIQGYAVSGRK